MAQICAPECMFGHVWLGPGVFGLDIRRLEQQLTGLWAANHYPTVTNSDSWAQLTAINRLTG